MYFPIYRIFRPARLVNDTATATAAAAAASDQVSKSYNYFDEEL
jgi:hypothetical protein